MKRLFFLIPDLKIAHEVLLDLEEMGIKERKIHVIGGTYEMLQQAHVPQATLFHTNIQPALKWGLIVGVCCCVLIFTLFTLGFPSDFRWHGQGLLAVVAFGMGFGLWSIGMVSLIKNPIIEKYEAYLKEGHYIMMVDTPIERAEILTQHVIHHPGTQLVEKRFH